VGVVFVTHNPRHAYPIGDRFVILRRGEVRGEYARRDLRLGELEGMMADREEMRQQLGDELGG
jgi:simple sugar transport system ATP-binding protein